WTIAKPFGGEIEKKTTAEFLHRPQRARMKKFSPEHKLNGGVPLHVRFNIVRVTVGRELRQLRPQFGTFRIIASHLHSDSGNSKAPRVPADRGGSAGSRGVTKNP